MKKILLLLLTLLVLICSFGFIACGEPGAEHNYVDGKCTICGDVDSNYWTEGLEYTLINDSEYSITGYSGSNLNVVIPAKYQGKPVTSIGKEAFYWNYLTSITIPNSVTCIGESAFEGCDLESIEIPNSVISIQVSAFSVCNSLTSIKIPNSVENIGEEAFSGCRSLSSFTFEDNSRLTVIENGLFSYSAISNVVIPSSVVSIGSSAFENCTSLISVKIPKEVTYIGYNAFFACWPLTIYCEVEEVQSGWSEEWNTICPVVWDCSNNEIADDGCVYVAIDGVKYSISDDVAHVSRQPDGNESVIIQSSINYKNETYTVTSIDRSAFYDCISLKQVEIPNTITYIGEGAFRSCSGLSSIVIPNSVKRIDYNAFSGCLNLSSVVLSEGVEFIASGAFSICSSLTSIVIPRSVYYVGDGAFQGCKKITIYCRKAKSQVSADGWNRNWNALLYDGSLVYDWCPVEYGYGG